MKQEKTTEKTIYNLSVGDKVLRVSCDNEWDLKIVSVVWTGRLSDTRAITFSDNNTCYLTSFSINKRCCHSTGDSYYYTTRVRQNLESCYLSIQNMCNLDLAMKLLGKIRKLEEDYERP